MIDALATAPQTGSGFAEASHRTIAFKTVLGELDVFRQSILRSGSESHTDRSLLFIGNRVSIFHRRIYNSSPPPCPRTSACSVLTGRRPTIPHVREPPRPLGRAGARPLGRGYGRGRGRENSQKNPKLPLDRGGGVNIVKYARSLQEPGTVGSTGPSPDGRSRTGWTWLQRHSAPFPRGGGAFTYGAENKTYTSCLMKTLLMWLCEKFRRFTCLWHTRGPVEKSPITESSITDPGKERRRDVEGHGQDDNEEDEVVPRKHPIDEAMDLYFGPEGGEGEQWSRYP